MKNRQETEMIFQQILNYGICKTDGKVADDMRPLSRAPLRSRFRLPLTSRLPFTLLLLFFLSLFLPSSSSFESISLSSSFFPHLIYSLPLLILLIVTYTSSLLLTLVYPFCMQALPWSQVGSYAWLKSSLFLFFFLFYYSFSA